MTLKSMAVARLDSKDISYETNALKADHFSVKRLSISRACRRVVVPSSPLENIARL